MNGLLRYFACLNFKIFYQLIDFSGRFWRYGNFRSLSIVNKIKSGYLLWVCVGWISVVSFAFVVYPLGPVFWSGPFDLSGLGHWRSSTLHGSILVNCIWITGLLCGVFCCLWPGSASRQYESAELSGQKGWRVSGRWLRSLGVDESGCSGGQLS